MKTMGRWHIICVICLVVWFLFVAEMVPLCFAADFDEADKTLKEAEQDVGLAFVAVADAEISGADVSALMIKLDVASAFLSEAHYAFNIEDYAGVNSAARAASSEVQGVVNDAERLRVFAIASRNNSLLYTFAWSGVGVAFLLVFGFFGWRFLKRQYLR